MMEYKMSLYTFGYKSEVSKVLYKSHYIALLSKSVDSHTYAIYPT